VAEDGEVLEAPGEEGIDFEPPAQKPSRISVIRPDAD